MTHEQILQKAIEKAVQNGWIPLLFTGIKDTNSILANWYHQIPAIIFQHDFAKAFWSGKSCWHTEGQYRHEALCEVSDAKYEWEYHLQQMVLEPDPIIYLQKFL